MHSLNAQGKARFSTPRDRGHILFSVSVISSYLRGDFLILRIKNIFQDSRYANIWKQNRVNDTQYIGVCRNMI